MKIFFGILFLLIAAAMVISGIGIIRDLPASGCSQAANDAQQTLACGLIFSGIIFFITGAIMVITKSSAQRRKKAELHALKHPRSKK